MSEKPDTLDAPTAEIEQKKHLSLESLSDEQLSALAESWQAVQDKETPMADLRSSLTDSGLFDFESKYNTDNIELRTMATAAQGALEHRQTGGRRAELEHILAAASKTDNFEAKRALLADLLGPDVKNMNNGQVDGFLKSAQAELDALNGARIDSEADAARDKLASTSDDAKPLREARHINKDLATEVSDLIDGQLAVDEADRVRYGAGATASGKMAAGQYVSNSQLRDIAAHADEIRQGLDGRDVPGWKDGVPLNGDDIDQEAMMRRYEAHNHPDEAPAEGREMEDEAPTVPTETETLSGDEIDQEAMARRYEAHTHPDEAPAEGREMDDDTEATESEPEAHDADGSDEEGESHPEDAPADNPEGDDVDPEAQPPATPDLNIYSIDETEDAKALARDAARAKWREKLQSGGRFKRFVKNLWMGENGVAGPYVYRKYYLEMLEQIQNEGDVLAHESNDREARRGAQISTIERFESGYLHDDAGERVSELEEDSAYGIAVKDLIRRYAQGEFQDEAAFMEERSRILNALGQAGHEDLIGEGGVRIDNMFLVAEQVKAMVDHGDSVDRIIEGMKVFSGEARSHVRTEAHLNTIDRIIDKLDNNPAGGLVSPVTLGAAGAIAFGVVGAGKGSLAAAAGMTVPGVLGGVFAGLREHKRLQDDRMLHAREMATGKEFDASSRRRVDIETTRYETVSARDLAQQLDAAFEFEEAMTPEQVQAAYEALALVEARVKLSDQRNIDLVSYSEATQVEAERQALDIARAQAKVKLAARLANLPPDFRANLEITDTDTVDDALNRYTDVIASIESDLSAKDKTYNRIRTRRVATAAAIGAATSLFIGLGSQELIAFANPNYEGLAEHLLNPASANGATKQTVLEGMFNGQEAVSGTPDTYQAFPLGTHTGALELPAGYTAVQATNGTFSIEGANGAHIVDNLTLNKNGSLTPESIDALRAHDVSVSDTGRLVTEYGTTTKKISVKAYNHEHARDITRISRDYWNDNNTPAPDFDHNELGLSYGGENATGVGPNGSIRMSVAGMTEDGSWHGSRHVSWEDAAEHDKLKLAISGSRGTQSDVYMVDIKPDGSINIPADSPAAKFFSEEDGKMKFHGGFLEAVETRGTSHGVTHVTPLATVSGDHTAHRITEQVQTVSERYVPHLKLTPPAENIETVGIGGPEIVVRRPLERLARRESYNYYGYGYEGDGDMSEEEVIKETNERSPRLKSNPDAELQPLEELSWYKDELLKRRGVEGLSSLEQKIDASNELSNMSGEVETIVTIPVAAVQEADTIYGALSLYGRQGNDSLRKSLVLLNLNWLDTATADPTKKAAIEKARQEIDRARKDFPDLKIAVIESEYNSKRVIETGGVIGYVAADLADSAMLAIQKRMQVGVMSSDHEVVLIRNDADPEGMSLRYLEQYQKAINDPKIKDMDVFKGVTRFGTKWAEKYPGFAVASNFAAALSVALSSRGLPATGGANFAIKASTLAAVGGLGDMARTGAGSDDGALGRRIRHARNGIGVTRKEDNTQSSVLPNGVKVNYRTVAAHVHGATVDTNPSRLVPYYVQGSSYANAWGSDFSSGDGGYRERTAGMTVTPDGKSEIANDWDTQFKGIEATITSEMRWNGTQDINRVLSIFFGQVPGSYVITGAGVNNGEESYYHNAEFKLTEAGKKFLKKRFKRDSYGKNLESNLYRGNPLKNRSPTLIRP
jgi:hypothetical protein